MFLEFKRTPPPAQSSPWTLKSLAPLERALPSSAASLNPPSYRGSVGAARNYSCDRAAEVCVGSTRMPSFSVSTTAPRTRKNCFVRSYSTAQVGASSGLNLPPGHENDEQSSNHTLYILYIYRTMKTHGCCLFLEIWAGMHFKPGKQ